jgi:hypothetical protein
MFELVPREYLAQVSAEFENFFSSQTHGSHNEGLWKKTALRAASTTIDDPGARHKGGGIAGRKVERVT